MSQRRPAVSVIISTYNRATIIGGALRALFEDQRPAAGLAYEVIVVDNNSSDGTAEVLEEFSRSHTGMRWLSEPRPGVSHGRNAGIAVAAAPIIAFTDDDIRVAPDWVATLKQLFDEHPEVDCIGGPVLPLWETKPPRWLDGRNWAPISVTDYGPRPFETSAALPRCLLTSNLAMRAEVFSRLKGFSPRFPRGQDHELQLRYWLAGGVALYAPKLVVWTEVPAARMKKAHHRRWHQLNGRVAARMWLRERCTPEGALRAEPVVGRTFLGVPLFLYRALILELRRWLKALAAGDASERFAREMAVRHVTSYILERRSEARNGNRPGGAAGTRRSREAVAGGRGIHPVESRLAGPEGASVPVTGRRPRLVLLYDGASRFCAMLALLVRVLDFSRRVEVLDTTADWPQLSARFPELRREACAGRLHLFSSGGRSWQGYRACREVAWHLPVGWLLLPFAYLPGMGKLGDSVFRAVADRRSRACLLVADGAGE